MEQPLISREEILRRQNAIEELNMNYISREELCEYLNPIYDLERLIGRISYRTGKSARSHRVWQFTGDASVYQTDFEGVFRRAA